MQEGLYLIAVILMYSQEFPRINLPSADLLRCVTIGSADIKTWKQNIINKYILQDEKVIGNEGESELELLNITLFLGQARSVEQITSYSIYVSNLDN